MIPCSSPKVSDAKKRLLQGVAGASALSVVGASSASAAVTVFTPETPASGSFVYFDPLSTSFITGWQNGNHPDHSIGIRNCGVSIFYDASVTNVSVVSFEYNDTTTALLLQGGEAIDQSLLYETPPWARFESGESPDSLNSLGEILGYRVEVGDGLFRYGWVQYDRESISGVTIHQWAIGDVGETVYAGVIPEPATIGAIFGLVAIGAIAAKRYISGKRNK